MRYSTFVLGSMVCVGLVAGCASPDHEDFHLAYGQYLLSHTEQLAFASDSRFPAQEEIRTDAFPKQNTWLAMGDQLEETERYPGFPPEQITEYVSWRIRRGPAYPDDFWRSIGRDAMEIPFTLWDDTKATATNKWAIAGLLVSVAAGVAVDAANWNGSTADHYSKKSSQLNTFWDNVGDVGGNPGFHFGIAGAMYFSSLYNKDTKNYEISKALINALALNGLATLALKGIADNESPNGDDLGWPSGHTSSTFCLATVMHEAYGPWVGIPLFAFATFVAYERVDARNHDLNDVVSGALIGIAIGYAVFQNHQPQVLGMDVIPYLDPAKGTVGLAFSKTW